MERNYKLYLHISPSNKRYYGITKQKLNRRFRSEGKGYRRSPHFYNAIQKYGWDNFQHILIFDNLTKEEAELLEQCYIALYQTNDKRYGYNMTNGGEGADGLDKESRQQISEKRQGKYTLGENPNAKKIICLENNQIFDSMLEVADFLNVDRATVYNAMKDKYKCKNYSFMEYSEYLEGIRYEFREQMLPHTTCIKCVETNETFNSIAEASKKMNIKYTTLRSAVRRNSKTHGYTFIYC